MTPESKLKKLEALLKLVDESITRDEFVSSFENVLNHVVEIEKKLNEKLGRATTEAAQNLQRDFTAVKNSSDEMFNFLRSTLETALARVFKEQADGMNFMRDSIRAVKKMQGPKGEKGEKGDRGLDGRHGRDGVDGKDGKDGAAGHSGGAKGFTLYVNGVKKLLTAQTINITGSGVTYNYANGRNDITITGGGGFSILTATGTIDNANTSFTFASEPTVVVVNGATYRHGAGCTIVGTSVTLDNPVGVGGDIYGIG